ncbi:dihydrofolate reductase family protein [Sphingobacterium sp. CZ-2]|uniref:dihydrofolate reductase family protein n=1 Tax=Sphingobacterium sp. CZ-2 TaxID=2557994 RepID=UPI00106F7A42|nr:dihydrofolate reductase family protein [Sphingobacterium sp. CZ-2]QBR13225.1 dihydrofolate reductase [Sphingobacterium sp. CZ-2]
MRKLIFFMHTSLDGYISTPNGDLSWAKLDEGISNWVYEMTQRSDMAMYGRVTYEMMQAYWPDAGKKPDASGHDKQHSAWYNQVDKVVISRTLDGTDLSHTTVMGHNLKQEINELKEAGGKDILIFGSPGASLSLLELGLIDEFYLLVNPIILGHGIPFLQKLPKTVSLHLLESQIFPSEVVLLHYAVKKQA